MILLLKYADGGQDTLPFKTVDDLELVFDRYPGALKAAMVADEDDMFTAIVDYINELSSRVHAEILTQDTPDGLRKSLALKAANLRKSDYSRYDDPEERRRLLHSHKGFLRAESMGERPEMEVTHGSHKLRIARDLIEQAGGKMKGSALAKHPDGLNPKDLGISHLQDGKGNISYADIKNHIDNLPRHKYAFSFADWGERRDNHPDPAPDNENHPARSLPADASDLYWEHLDTIEVGEDDLPREPWDIPAFGGYINRIDYDSIVSNNYVEDMVDPDTIDEIAEREGVDSEDVTWDMVDDDLINMYVEDERNHVIENWDDEKEHFLSWAQNSGYAPEDVFGRDLLDSQLESFRDGNEVGYSRTDGGQQHTDEASKVFQLNLHPDAMAQIENEGLKDVYEDQLYAHRNTNHPEAENGLGWVRYTDSADGGIHIDEIQSDIGQGISRKISDLKGKIKSGSLDEAETQFAHRDLGQLQKLFGIMFNGQNPSQALHDGFHENMRRAGRHNDKVHIFEAPQKGRLSGMRVDGLMDENGKTVKPKKKGISFQELGTAQQNKAKIRRANVINGHIDRLGDHAPHFIQGLEDAGFLDKDGEFSEEFLNTNLAYGSILTAKIRGVDPAEAMREVVGTAKPITYDEQGNIFSPPPKLPVHMTNTYGKQPKKMGYKESEYGELETQSNDKLQGSSTRSETIRKKRPDWRSMVKSARARNMRKNYTPYEGGELSVAHNSHKIRKLRDFIAKHGKDGRMKHSDLKKAGFDVKSMGLQGYQDGKGFIGADDIHNHINEMPRHKYNVSFGEWGSEGDASPWGDSSEWGVDTIFDMGYDPDILKKDDFDPVMVDGYLEAIADDYENGDYEVTSELANLDSMPKEVYDQLLTKSYEETGYQEIPMSMVPDEYIDELRDAIKKRHLDDWDELINIPSLVDWATAYHSNKATDVFSPDFIDQVNMSAYDPDHESFRENQQHSNEPSTVFQLNTHPDTLERIREAGLGDVYTDMYHTNTATYHPGGEHQIGWVRYTGDKDGIQIDEAQSDLVQDAIEHVDAFEKGKDTRAPNYLKEHGVDKVKKLLNILTDGMSPQQMLLDSFMENLNQSDLAGTDVHIHDKAFKSKLAHHDVSGHFEGDGVTKREYKKFANLPPEHQQRLRDNAQMALSTIYRSATGADGKGEENEHFANQFRSAGLVDDEGMIRSDLDVAHLGLGYAGDRTNLRNALREGRLADHIKTAEKDFRKKRNLFVDSAYGEIKRDNPRALAPHMKLGYETQPKKMGFEEGAKYGDLDTQTTEDYQGAPQLKETVRKKRSDIRSMIKSARRKNLRKSSDFEDKLRALHDHGTHADVAGTEEGLDPHIEVAHGSHKLRIARDLIEQAGGKMKGSALARTPENLNPKDLGITHLQDAKGFISHEAIKNHIDSLPRRKYSFSFGDYGTPQRKRNPEYQYPPNPDDMDNEELWEKIKERVEEDGYNDLEMPRDIIEEVIGEDYDYLYENITSGESPAHHISDDLVKSIMEEKEWRKGLRNNV